MDSGGSAGAPAPFLLKTYEMVEDDSTDEIVSWSERKNSFVVWNPPEFSRVLLPAYFKHNNFSSFIRQLNTYGFKKIDAEKWEFANDFFVRGKKHLLKNIHRKKPIYSHSHPPSGENNERSAMEEEIERLTSENSSLESSLSRFKLQNSRTKFQVSGLQRRLLNMDHQQQKMFSFVSRAMQNPNFVDHLIRMSSAALPDLSEFHRKRRLPGEDQNPSEFSGKLRLGLPSSISDSSTPSPETIDFSDSATSVCPRNEEEGDRNISCLLNLTLSSSPLQPMSTTNASKIKDDRKISAQPGRANDKFWEQFLTERPGSSDTEEANSALKVNSPAEDHVTETALRRNRKDMDRLSL